MPWVPSRTTYKYIIYSGRKKNLTIPSLNCWSDRKPTVETILLYMPLYTHYTLHNINSPMNSIAWGKKLARFWPMWSEMGICIYLIDPCSSKVFGKSDVTFKMYWKPERTEIKTSVYTPWHILYNMYYELVYIYIYNTYL